MALDIYLCHIDFFIPISDSSSDFLPRSLNYENGPDDINGTLHLETNTSTLTMFVTNGCQPYD